ncbi:uncharacterized protein LOC142025262 [Carettochelys insculpta]|uniref:uncharacterized protein LOC142025262 n=1 Tax=Carettochelys insculpta TaxID=44489 RepID=UPI003EB80E85
MAMAGPVPYAPAGLDLGWAVAGAEWHHRRDWALTSSGVGLESRALPPPATRPVGRGLRALSPPQPTLQKPLPPGGERPPREELTQRLATTTGLCHVLKTCGGVLGQPRAPPPAALRSLHYSKDLRDKLQLRAWRGPLSPGVRPSETRHQFCGWPNLPPMATHHPGPQPFGLAAHHSQGPSKSLVPSTENQPLAGAPFYIRDRAVLRLLDPNISVTSRDIRAFTPQELQGYAQKEPLTYWEFAGGHGLREPPIQPPSSPKDSGVGPHARLPPLVPAVPHRGAQSLAQESYGSLRPTPCSQAPPAQPPTICTPAAAPHSLAVPLIPRAHGAGVWGRGPVGKATPEAKGPAPHLLCPALCSPQCGLRALTLVLLLAGGTPGAPRGRRFCRPLNATIAAEKDKCPVCVTFTTAICSGYCQTKEPVYKSALAPVAQQVCTYRAVRYETRPLPRCPPGVDPTFTFPVALSCHCSLCPTASSDCTVTSLAPDFCSAPGGFA